MHPLPLITTESDPDAFIHGCVNAISGDYCESAIDLLITGPDALILQRFYSSRNAVDGSQEGGWRILPQRFLVIGNGFLNKTCLVGQELFTWSLALTGDRSGGILPYTGWRDDKGYTRAPLKIDILNKAIGVVNTSAKEINGQTNRQSQILRTKGTHCEIFLGDGTKRIYKQVSQLPSLLLGEELTPTMSSQVWEPEYYLLTQETLPSGNHLLFSYDGEGHLSAVEMKNRTLTKTFSWIHFTYEFHNLECRVIIDTSDSKSLIYHLSLDNGSYKLMKVEGSHVIPTSYEYNGALIKKTLPEGNFTEIEYEDGKVIALKGPHPSSGLSQNIYSFSYSQNSTDVFNAMGIRTRYIYDPRFQLISIERYNDQDSLYHVEKKFWGTSKADEGRLLAKTIGDGNGRIYSYRSFQYDKSGNVLEERLYGNLTGKQEVSLKITPEGQLLNPNEEECHIKSFGYSSDGFNLLTKIGDAKGNHTQYIYQPNTNLLIKKFIFNQEIIKKRTFYSYNDDGVCIKTIEDDGSDEDENKIIDCKLTERHITEIQPKQTLPGVGLPLVITKKALNLNRQQEVMVKRLINTYDLQSRLIASDTYDARNQYMFTEKKEYNDLGKVILHVDSSGRKTINTYDALGNCISTSLPDSNQSFSFLYDCHNQPIEITECNNEGQFTICYAYDLLGRKISSTDKFGNSTFFEYDAFDRLVKVIHPEVLNEKNEIVRPLFTYGYNIFGHVVTLQDPKGYITSKTYNLHGDPSKIMYPDGSSELFKYDVEGSLHRSLDRDQVVTVYEYDYLGRVIYEEVSTTGEKGVISFMGGRSYKYNGFRCIYEKVDNHIKEYGYGAAGRLTSVVEFENGTSLFNSQSRRTEMSYGTLGRLCQKKIWFGSGENDYRLEYFQNDRAGNVLKKKITDSEGHVLLAKNFSYNNQNQCIEEYVLDGNKKTSIFKTAYNTEGEPIHYIDALGEETRVIIDYNYQNALGQKVLHKKIIDPLGVVTEIEFDALKRIHNICKKDPSGVLLSSQKILYDTVGNKACEIHNQIVDGIVIGCQKTLWIYGPNGRLEEEIEAPETPLEKRTRYYYNSLGKMIEKKLEDSATSLYYTYNKDGRLYKIEAKNNNNHLNIFISYSYDRRGNIISAYSLHGNSVKRKYDAFNQVTQEIIEDGEGTYSLQYSYDRIGRPREIVLPDQSKIVYTYDALFGRAVKRLSAENEEIYSHEYYHYDTEGKLLEELLSNGLGPRLHTYDLCGQKISTQCELLNEEYSRDSLGRLTKVTGNKEYAYNNLSQIISEKGKSYAYDSLNNCLKINNEELTVNALNQLTSHSKIEFSYDPQGNLQRKIHDGKETQFEHNLLSQLVYLENSDKTANTYSYDPFGRLLVQKHLNIKNKNKKILSTSRYFYVGYQEIGTLNQTGKIETLKVPGIKGNELANTSIAFELNGKTYVPLHDISGNVVRLIDPENHETVERYQYSAFGKEIIYDTKGLVIKPTEALNPWRFAEKRVDQKSGLILFGFRFYDPSIARWISRDPAGGIDGPNLYAYLHNNPINHFDRFGLATEDQSQNSFYPYMYGEVESHCYCEKHRTCKRGGDIGKTVGSGLPKISYRDRFEEFSSNYQSEEDFWAKKDFYDDYRPYYEPSKNFDLSENQLSNLPDGLGIGFINGVWNNPRSSKESAEYISRLASGYNVHAVYNATHGRTVDLIECWLGLNFIATDPVRQLHKMWNSFFEKNSVNVKFLMICHSQGAIHVRNALLDYPPELRNRILVVAIAPGAYIYKETCAKVIHYRAEWWRDFIPWLDGAGADREKNTIVNLSSDPNAPLFDHEFISPTYQDQLQRHIKNYINTKGKIL